MELNLKKSIAFFDLETTGIDVGKDRIVEIAILKINPNQSTETKTMRINPTVPIPKETSKIHGIFDVDVENAPTFKQVAKEISKFLEGCDLAGYNSNRFDIPLLAEEFMRADVEFSIKSRKFIDVQVIYHKKEQRTLSAAYQYYCKKELVGAHGAMADTNATYEILKSQIEMYEDIENDMEALSKISYHQKTADLAGRIGYNKKGEEIFLFSKHKGKTVEEILEKEPGFVTWMLNSDFPLYTKKVLTEIKLRKSGLMG